MPQRISSAIRPSTSSHRAHSLVQDLADLSQVVDRRRLSINRRMELVRQDRVALHRQLARHWVLPELPHHGRQRA